MTVRQNERTIDLVLVLSMITGYASWHLFEKRAISMGNRISKRFDRDERASNITP